MARYPNGYDLERVEIEDLEDIIQSKQIRKRILAEAKVTSMRRSLPVQKSGKGFGAAVAFATGSHKRKNATIIDMAGGKRLKIPNSKPPARDFKRKMR